MVDKKAALYPQDRNTNSSFEVFLLLMISPLSKGTVHILGGNFSKVRSSYYPHGILPRPSKVEIHDRQMLFQTFKVVLEGYHRYFFGVKVKTVKLIGGRRLRLLYMPAQVIQMMAFTQIMAIWTPAITL